MSLLVLQWPWSKPFLYPLLTSHQTLLIVLIHLGSQEIVRFWELLTHHDAPLVQNHGFKRDMMAFESGLSGVIKWDELRDDLEHAVQQNRSNQL